MSRTNLLEDDLLDVQFRHNVGEKHPVEVDTPPPHREDKVTGIGIIVMIVIMATVIGVLIGLVGD